VSTISGLYERFRHLIHEGAKFLVVGLIGTIVTFGVANALQGIGRYKAITIATILAGCAAHPAAVKPVTTPETPRPRRDSWKHFVDDLYWNVELKD